MGVDATKLLELLQDDGTFTIDVMSVIAPDEMHSLLFDVARVVAEILQGLDLLQP